jgi:dTDP-4-dehydrorhamnose reductase
MKTQVIGTGLSGLVGSRIVELLQKTYQFVDISRRTGTDILKNFAVEEKIKKSSAEVVLHFAAKTDVDGCEKDKIQGIKGDAWKINVDGTKNIVSSCQKFKKKLIYISTDFVFDGENTPQEGYSEDNMPNPVNWYARTKYEGEKIVQSAHIPWIILRIAYPFRANYPKMEYVRNILTRLKENREVFAVTDHFFTPTFIDDLGNALDVLIKNNATGIYHAVGKQSVSPYKVAQLIANVFNLNASFIHQTTRKQFFKDRAQRPFNTSLKNDKIGKFAINMHTFEEGLQEIKRQIEHNL